MTESVLVPDDLAGPPPFLDLRMSWFGHDDVAKALSILRIAPVVKLQTVHLFEIEKRGACLAVDLERD
jgi:hypothetical protein